MHDTWLVKHATGADVSDAALLDAVVRLASSLAPAPARIGVHRALAGDETYAYFELAAAIALSDADRAALEDVARALPLFAVGSFAAHRLTRKLSPAAASAAEAARYLYVVETDAAEGWDDELARWYDTEHMRGLASVPGCVRAQRFVNADGRPWSHACYDLVRPEATSSPAWLGVRATAWSDRVRPQFRNTKRTMFRVLPGLR